ncbi:MAG: D-lactate dehydrogenase (cytochrome) [Parasphingorhabdus sp.]|jgi:D-lactate dehydrogenase (cytochrome)
MKANRTEIPQVVSETLREKFSDRVSVSPPVLERFGKDESYHPSFPPDMVITVNDVEEVSFIMKLCNKHRIPVIPYGAGTSLEGSVAALYGGICINLQDMNQVLKVNHEDLDVVVQPGVTRRQLNSYLRDTGLFFPVDPGANASIGGMVSTRASGTNAVRYGTMRENVMSLQVVLPDGQIIRTGSRARKSAAGYDLTRLYTGAEGTLGIITEITLRVYGIPESISAAVCSFASLGDAVQAVIQTIQIGVPVARIELLDAVQIDAINRYSKTDYTVAPTLFLEFHGTQASVTEQAQTVEEVSQEFGGGDFKWTTNAEQRNLLWRARHDAAYACKALKPDGQIWATDVCVPISRLAECIDITRKDLDAHNLMAPIVGHVGDGNFHLLILVDHNSEDEVARAEAANERMVKRALEMGGTSTGEHGIGYGKLDFLIEEHGPAVDIMRNIKQTLDPNGIMNPGKVVRMV